MQIAQTPNQTEPDEFTFHSEFITQRYLDAIFTGTVIPVTPLTNELQRTLMAPPIGAHLSTPGLGGIYTHHGIYVGNNEVIHYSGMANVSTSANLSGPVEKVSLVEFANDNGFHIVHHDLPTYSSQQIVQNAYSRLHETQYNLFWNNCEHFVHDCIFAEKHSTQVQRGKTAALIAAAKVSGEVARNLSDVTKVSGKVARNLSAATKVSGKVAGNLNVGVHFTTALQDSAKAIKDYLSNKKSGKECVEAISSTVISNASVGYYSLLGQAAIPVPFAGALIGAGVGFVIGNMLLSSGHLSLGKSDAVKYAKARREQIETLCAELIPTIRNSRLQLENYLESHFADRRESIGLALNAIEASAHEGHSEQLTEGLLKLNDSFGKTLQFKSFEEFDEFMLSDDNFAF